MREALRRSLYPVLCSCSPTAEAADLSSAQVWVQIPSRAFCDSSSTDRTADCGSADKSSTLFYHPILAGSLACRHADIILTGKETSWKGVSNRVIPGVPVRVRVSVLCCVRIMVIHRSRKAASREGLAGSSPVRSVIYAVYAGWLCKLS